MTIELTEAVEVVHECDVCVVGGGPAGCFAAVRAARLGASVCIVEQLSAFGGTSCLAQVNDWHSIHDTTGRRRIVGGLIVEMIERLRARGAVVEFEPGSRIEFRFNSAEMSVDLDHMLLEAGVRPFLCSTLSAAVSEDGRLRTIVIDDKSGRRAIRARQFIDATGDGDLLCRCGLPTRKADSLQPVSQQYLVAGLKTLQEATGIDSLWPAVRDLRHEHGHPDSAPWIHAIPKARDAHNVLGPRLHGVDASDPDERTAALIEGRRLGRAFVDLLRERFGEAAANVALLSFAPLLGVRQTRQAVCRYRLDEAGLMSGRGFDDTVALGVYPVDIHHSGGTVLRYLNGEEEVITPGRPTERRRWRAASEPVPPYYCIPFRALVPKGSINVLVAGRLIDADDGAYGATRVVVVCAQFGEAAGIAAALAAAEDIAISDVDVARVQHHLREAGTAIP